MGSYISSYWTNNSSSSPRSEPERAQESTNTSVNYDNLRSRPSLEQLELPENHIRSIAAIMDRFDANDAYYASSDGDEDELRQRSLQSSQRLMTVFRMLIRSGQINVMSSGEDSDEDDDEAEYVLPEDRRKIRPPKETYAPNLQNINENDISLKMRGEPLTKLDLKGNAIPKMIINRELGMTRSLHGGYSKKQKANIVAEFLPDSVEKVCNFGHKAFCGTYSKDGSIFLSAAQDRSIRVFNTSNGKFRQFKRVSARDVGWSVLDTAFSPDGRYIAYSSWSESIHIFRLHGEGEHHDSLPLVPDTRRFCIFSIAFSENGNEILGGANDGFLYIYDRDRNERVLKISAHDEDVNAVAFADETSQILYSVADDALVKVWDRRCLNEADPKPVGLLAGHIDGITFVDSKQDGRYLITNSKDQSIKLWDLRMFSQPTALVACREAMDKNRWDYRWQRVPKRLCVPRESVAGDTSVMTYRGHSVLNTLIRCRFSPPGPTNQRFVYTGCAAGRVVIYDLLTGKIMRVLDGHDACVRDVSWHPDFPEIVSTSWDGSLGRWTSSSRHALSEEEAEVIGIKRSSQNVHNLRRSSRLAARRSASSAVPSTDDEPMVH